MKIQRIATLLLGLMATAPVFLGAETDEFQVPHTFSAGQPALAAEVNQNFSALSLAINQLAARIDSLENSPGNSGNNSGSIEGTYRFVSTQTEFFGRNFVRGGYVEHNAYVGEGELRMKADGTWDLDVSEFEHRISSIGDLRFDEDGEQVGMQQLEIATFPETESLSGSWSRVGSTVTLRQGPEEIVEFIISLGGDVLLAANNERKIQSQTYTGAQAGIIVAIKTHNP